MWQVSPAVSVGEAVREVLWMWVEGKLGWTSGLDGNGASPEAGARRPFALSLWCHNELAQATCPFRSRPCAQLTSHLGLTACPHRDASFQA